MRDLNDPSRMHGRLGDELERLEAGDIPEEDKQAIKEFLTHLRANKDNEPQSNANHVQHLRKTSEWVDKLLDDMEKSDIDNLTVELQHTRDYAKSTINGYKKTWRPFFDSRGCEWADDIQYFKTEEKKVEAWKVFSDEEVDAMIETATGRTTAVIAVLADTGLRIGGLLSIPHGNAELNGQVPILVLNDHAPTKGAEGNIPLTFSRAYLSSYLSNDHPRPDRDDVALFHAAPGYYDDDGLGGVTGATVREQIKDVMEEVGIEPRRRKPHHFRHTAVTNWRRQGIPESVIQHRTKWADMRMLKWYSHLVEEDKDMMTAEAFGLIDPDETDDTSTPEDAIGECPVCQSTVRGGARFCPGCGNPLDVGAAHDLPPDGVQDPEETAEELADMDGVLDEMDTATVIERLIQKNPSLLDDLDLD